MIQIPHAEMRYLLAGSKGICFLHIVTLEPVYSLRQRTRVTGVIRRALAGAVR